jgi:hypothetical protein
MTSRRGGRPRRGPRARAFRGLGWFRLSSRAKLGSEAGRLHQRSPSVIGTTMAWLSL